jgi:hypothetical protein
MKSIIIVIFTIFCTACYSTRKINANYEGSKSNVRHVFTGGHVACNTGVCLSIYKEKSKNCSYTFYASKNIGINGKLSVKKRNDGNSFVAKVKLTHLLFKRDKDDEINMLEEIAKSVGQ